MSPYARAQEVGLCYLRPWVRSALWQSARRWASPAENGLCSSELIQWYGNSCPAYALLHTAANVFRTPTKFSIPSIRSLARASSDSCMSSNSRTSTPSNERQLGLQMAYNHWAVRLTSTINIPIATREASSGIFIPSGNHRGKSSIIVF